MSEASRWAAAQVEAVRESPERRLALMHSLYERIDPGGRRRVVPFRRAATAFMQWQLRRGLLEPVASDGSAGGSPWWRAVNERLLRDTAEAGALAAGLDGSPSSRSVALALAFLEQPSAPAWYRAHNASVVAGYLQNRALAEDENRVERFFVNLVLARVLYAHAMVTAPRLALSWAAPVALALGDPRMGMTGMFLSLGRVLPPRYPARGELELYTDAEHGFGRLLDVGVIRPRFVPVYGWSAVELGQPELAGLLTDGVPSYAWDPADDAPWNLTPTLLARTARRGLPARRS